MKVALFGGSFNPIHNGHLKIANELINKKIVEEVWFIPCGNHPFDKELINGQDRIKMIKIAIGNNLKLKVIDIEIISNNISYTSETIKLLKDKFKEVEFYFIIGADNLINLQKWRNFGYLKNNVEFILVKRPEYELTSTLGIRIIYTLEMGNTISSTKIRNLLSNCSPIKNLVSQNVENYIKREELYNARPLCKSC